MNQGKNQKSESYEKSHEAEKNLRVGPRFATQDVGQQINLILRSDYEIVKHLIVASSQDIPARELARVPVTRAKDFFAGRFFEFVKLKREETDSGDEEIKRRDNQTKEEFNEKPVAQKEKSAAENKLRDVIRVGKKTFAINIIHLNYVVKVKMTSTNSQFPSEYVKKDTRRNTPSQTAISVVTQKNEKKQKGKKTVFSKFKSFLGNKICMPICKASNVVIVSFMRTVDAIGADTHLTEGWDF